MCKDLVVEEKKKQTKEDKKEKRQAPYPRRSGSDHKRIDQG